MSGAEFRGGQVVLQRFQHSFDVEFLVLVDFSADDVAQEAFAPVELGQAGMNPDVGENFVAGTAVYPTGLWLVDGRRLLDASGRPGSQALQK